MKITCIDDLQGLLFPYQLRGANLEGAKLEGAKLEHAILMDADLRIADLRFADLRGAKFEGAILRGANLRQADLTGADLTGADLRFANLESANLSGAKLPELLVKLPPLGQSFIAWKKVRDSSYRDIVLKLEIPADSPRVSTFVGRKCRAKSAKALEAFVAFGELFVWEPCMWTEFRSLHDFSFIYRIGETVEVPGFDDDIRVECTRGIHFFETREEAERYSF